MKYHLYPAGNEDAGWINKLTRETMKPYVDLSWTTESEQEAYYKLNEFDEESTMVIVVDGEKVGRLTCITENKSIDLAELHLIPSFQGKGLGSIIIKDVIDDAALKALTVKLKCLRTNPARNLYRKLGFVQVDEDDKRLYFEYPAEKVVS